MRNIYGAVGGRCVYAVRDCLFCFGFSLGRRRRLGAPPQREFEAKKTDAHRMHAAPANSAMFISQVFFFCFELSLGRGAAPRCNVCAWSLSLSLFLNRARRRDTFTFRHAATPCHAEARRVNCVAVGRADCSRLLSHRCSRALLAVGAWLMTRAKT